MYEDEESGGIIEKVWFKEKREGFVVVREIATVMVCIRLVSLKVELHLCPFLNIISTSFSSAFTNLSMLNIQQGERPDWSGGFWLLAFGFLNEYFYLVEWFGYIY